jgi:hypothetical protein
LGYLIARKEKGGINISLGARKEKPPPLKDLVASDKMPLPPWMQGDGGVRWRGIVKNTLFNSNFLGLNFKKKKL